MCVFVCVRCVMLWDTRPQPAKKSTTASSSSRKTTPTRLADLDLTWKPFYKVHDSKMSILISHAMYVFCADSLLVVLSGPSRYPCRDRSYQRPTLPHGSVSERDRGRGRGASKVVIMAARVKGQRWAVEAVLPRLSV